MKDGIVRDLLRQNEKQFLENLRQHNAIQAALSYLQRGQMIAVSKAIEILKGVQG